MNQANNSLEMHVVAVADAVADTSVNTSVGTPPSDLAFIDARLGDPVRVRPTFELYANTKNLCIRLVCAGHQGDLVDGEPWGTVTLNGAAIDEPDLVALKVYSENEGLAELMAQAGILELQSDAFKAPQANQGSPAAPMAKLTPAALKLAEPTLEHREHLLKKRSPRP